MELRNLKAFVMAARQLNFSEAARQLCVTQSTLSQNIKQLENETGYALFYRNSHEVQLTEAGTELLPYAEKTIQTAVAMELLHTASLVHDDVVDNSPTRRGAPSVQAIFGNKVAVLVGDFLLARVIEITANLRNLKILNIVADMGKTLSTGEIMQLHAYASPWITEESYMRVIDQKTASLFAACTQAGGVSSGASAKQETQLRTFGREIGLIFQMKDDVLDYSEQEIGKPTLSDIRDGKATLPLIVALNRAPQDEAAAIRSIAEQLSESPHPDEDMQRIQSFVLKYDGIRYVERQMQAHKQKAHDALASFHQSDVKSALLQLLQYIIIRTY